MLFLLQGLPLSQMLNALIHRGVPRHYNGLCHCIRYRPLQGRQNLLTVCLYMDLPGQLLRSCGQVVLGLAL